MKRRRSPADLFWDLPGVPQLPPEAAFHNLRAQAAGEPLAEGVASRLRAAAAEQLEIPEVGKMKAEDSCPGSCCSMKCEEV
jgi:hypothetical protein